MENYYAGGEIRLTIIRDTGLSRRLYSELAFVFSQAKSAWPTFRKNPIRFLLQLWARRLRSFKAWLRRSYVISASLMAILSVISIAITVFVLSLHKGKPSVIERADLSQVVRIDLTIGSNTELESAIGANGQGRVGLKQKTGEGSLSTPARASGGGGGGMNSPKPQQQGRIPVPSDIPAPIPINRVTLPPTLPDAGIDIDPTLWRNLTYNSYGDPRSKSAEASSGSGDGGGIGWSRGTGIGEGDGSGFGPGKDGNIGGGPKNIGGLGGGSGSGGRVNDINRIFRAPDVSEKAQLLSKPEPQYTEEARRNQITGTVILRVVFSKSGDVTNIRALQSLPSGLTEKAIAAARQIRFLPARKSGQPVSVYMQLEYNFNLY